MIEKLKSRTGETITETLVALLIACVSVVMVTGAVIASARINDKTSNKLHPDFIVTDLSTTMEDVSVTITINDKNASDLKTPPEAIKANVYGTSNSFYYYEKDSNN